MIMGWPAGDIGVRTDLETRLVVIRILRVKGATFSVETGSLLENNVYKCLLLFCSDFMIQHNTNS